MALTTSFTEDPVLKNLTEISVNALKDLEIARNELKENDLRMNEMNRVANERVKEMSKVNHHLQEKISFVENMTKNIQEKNEHLEKELKNVNSEKVHYTKLNKSLKNDLSKVIKKDKELAVKQIFLEKKIEEQENNLARTEKMAMIGQFTSRLAHDIRNPLSKLQLSHNILCENPNFQVLEKVKHQKRISQSISEMTHIVEDVLEFVRVSDLDLKESSLKQILESSKDSIIIPPTVNFQIEGKDVKILCDGRKMEAVFGNMLSNAIEAIHSDGYVIIKIIDYSNYVEVYIEDSGEGIPSDIESKIFDPLFTTKRSGSGLGLAISKTIVDQHGGSIIYKNHPSSFSIKLKKINKYTSEKNSSIC